MDFLLFGFFNSLENGNVKKKKKNQNKKNLSAKELKTTRETKLNGIEKQGKFTRIYMREDKVRFKKNKIGL